MLKLDYKAVHLFVDGYENARWDGWDVLLFKPTQAGATHRKGAFINGQWGIETRIEPDSEGKWRLRV